MPAGSSNSRGWSASASTVRPSTSPPIHLHKGKAVLSVSSPDVRPARPTSRSRSPSRRRSAASTGLQSRSPARRLDNHGTTEFRARIPIWISRFTGYRPPSQNPPYEPIPIPPFSWLKRIPLKYEIWLFSFIGCLVGILLIEAICTTSTHLREVFKSPLIITSFGAASTLLFGVIESPLAQPRNHIFGNLIGSITGVVFTKLFRLNDARNEYLNSIGEGSAFNSRSFANCALTVAVTMVLMLITGTVHPPAGATALSAAVDPQIVSMGWTYIPVVLSSSTLLLGWALVINNLGRRRYPVYWWTPPSTETKPGPETEKNGNRPPCMAVEVEEGDEPEDVGSSKEKEDVTPSGRMRSMADNGSVSLKSLEEGTLRKYEDGGKIAQEPLVEQPQDRSSLLDRIPQTNDAVNSVSERQHRSSEPPEKVIAS
ncbi:uncharacterized protein I303_108027 [Kwoniella dejecticola CBS 10117]|uniref:HPP transmembrane region domain-containing protein n=1 Tax=Kwoniella dejecticola CBS 10117 TaxID=1296121 RepID=A0A1A5ZWC8_9TREE|nr:uncharacterized protein I303_08018 [Kwoniella dejecticola CBS 10117]OBR82104.1 hypothetical protein I303_08018 [Kwoniella dejecticola CBS 10117]